MSTEPSAPQRRSRVRTVVVVLVALAACVQLFGVTFISIPPQSAPPGTRSAAEVVLHSYFEEEWKLFAPSPVNADRDLMVQAAWREGETVEVGEWINLTAIDDSVVQHAVGAPRSAYLTSRLAGGLDAVWSNVTGEIRTAVADASSETAPLTDADVRDLLGEEDVTGLARDLIAERDLGATTYLTDVFRSLEPDRELVAVRYGTRLSTAPTWELRHDAEKSVGAVTEGPWRTPVEDDPDRRRSIADYLERNS
ncbi:DUF5819 family protein [Aeromicrobium sp. Leaf350]|uniref:DUF5819 family protein n=1 Tax=Aeromicrobium sp. Leaf350 TaxID=2876565 RepID=UPI001E4BC3F5|nr:DUF5819 family protein [Aeromicrobium sp. Leaf350]